MYLAVFLGDHYSGQAPGAEIARDPVFLVTFLCG